MSLPVRKNTIIYRLHSLEETLFIVYDLGVRIMNVHAYTGCLKINRSGHGIIRDGDGVHDVVD